MRRFLNQLRRRNVLKSMATYLLVAWLVVQVLDVVGPALGMNDRFMTIAVITLAIGFPIVTLVSWFFELTPSGFRRESAATAEAAGPGSQVFNYVIIAMLAAALGVSLVTRDAGDFSGGDVSLPPTIAVLPLEKLGDTPDDGFVDGLHEDLMTTLGRIQSLRVISRTSVLRFAVERPSVIEIGQRLGAAAIVEGSVQRVGDRVRINVRLIDASNDERLWSQLFERPVSAVSLFAIQREIAQTIAAQLRIALTGEEEAALGREPTDNLEAYSAYLLGRQRLAQRTSASVEQAETFFRRAVAIDPNYAEAWAGVAEAIYQQHGYASLERDTMLQTAMPPVQHALRLNPELSEAHAVLGALRVASRDEQGAEASFLRAIELNPSHAQPFLWLGSLKFQQGRHDEALAWHAQALTLDPLSPTFSNALAQDYLALGRSDEAAAQYRKSLEIDPDFVATYAHLSELERVANGRPDKSVALLQRAYALDPRHSEYAALVAQSLIELDDPDSAAPWVALAMQTAPDQFWACRVNLLLALRRNQADEIDAALEHYESQLGGAWLTLVARRDRLLQAGNVAGAREHFISAIPEFFDSPPKVERANFYLAPALAVIHLAAGDDAAADALLDAASEVLAGLRADGYTDFDLSEVEILALQGETERAVELLELGISNDYINLWWYLPRGRNLEALHGDARFQATIDRILNQMHALRDGIPLPERIPPSL